MSQNEKDCRYDKPLLGAEGSARIAESVDMIRKPIEEAEAAKATRGTRKPLYGTTK